MTVTPRELRNRLDKFEQEAGKQDLQNLQTVFIIEEGQEPTEEQREQMARAGEAGKQVVILPSNHRLMKDV